MTSKDSGIHPEIPTLPQLPALLETRMNEIQNSTITTTKNILCENDNSTAAEIIAQVMANITERGKRSIFYPFHKDGWKTLSMHIITSALVCIGPVYIIIHMLLSNPGDSFYFWLRG